MRFTRFSKILALVPLLMLGSASLGLAQTADPYSGWTYLYNDSFETSAGTLVDQEWRLDPDVQRTDNLLNFTLLARRNPVGANGAAAAVFDYVADCSTLDYALEKATHLDSNNASLGSQTYGAVMEAADRESNPNFYDTLDRLCKGDLPG